MIKIVPQCYIEAVCLIYKGYQGVSLIPKAPKAQRSEVEETNRWQGDVKGVDSHERH